MLEEKRKPAGHSSAAEEERRRRQRAGSAASAELAEPMGPAGLWERVAELLLRRRAAAAFAWERPEPVELLRSSEDRAGRSRR